MKWMKIEQIVCLFSTGHSVKYQFVSEYRSTSVSFSVAVQWADYTVLMCSMVCKKVFMVVVGAVYPIEVFKK